jgi:prepilin peptidase CpaA
MLEAATLLFFPVLMIFAALSDLLTMTISNRVSIALAVLFLIMAFACGLSAADIFWHLACGAAMLVLTFIMFARGWIGGGDAKLAAATAIWLGFEHLGDYALLFLSFEQAQPGRHKRTASGGTGILAQIGQRVAS